MKTKSLDNNQSYLLGFLQSDGHRATSNHNSIQIELSIKDIDILEKIKQSFGLSSNIMQRTRDTNFKENYTSCRLHFHKDYICDIIDFIPFGSKSYNVKPPMNIMYSEFDYWRGFIDGDGSLGFRKSSSNKKYGVEPFISIATSSEYIARSFEKFVFKHFYSKNHSNRNKRDEQFNITIAGYYCTLVVEKLYYNGCLSMDRKMAEANAILRLAGTNSQKRHPFSREEDTALLLNSPNDSISLPNRKLSVSKNRLKYLLSKGIDSSDKLLDINYFI